MKTKQTDIRNVMGNPFYGTKAALPEPNPNKAQHSPLPWRAVQNHAGVSEFTELEDENGKEIGYLYKLGDLDKISNENAKLIVASVNHADKLAEALRDVMTTVEAGHIAADLNCIDTSREALAAYEASRQ